MNRRAYLSTVGLTVSATLGGCTTDGAYSGEATATVTPTRSPEPDGVSIERIVVRKAVRYESLNGSGGVLAADGHQYVVAAVTSNRGPEPTEFAFETDGRSWEVGLPDTAGAINASVAGIEGTPVGYYAAGMPRSYLAFVVPSPLSASDPRIRYESRFDRSETTEWPLPPAARDRLAAPEPRFALGALDVPDEVEQGEPLPVSLTVTNTSDTDGRFLAAVYWPLETVADADHSHVVERRVTANDEVTASLVVDTRHTAYESKSVELSVRGHVSAERDVFVRTG